MRRSSLFSLFVAAAVVGTAAVPSSADAQFKPKLPGKLGKVISGEKDEPAAVPKFNDRTIEITEAHAQAVVAGMRMQNDSLTAQRARYMLAHRAYTDSMKAYPRLKSEYEQAKKAWDACQEREVKPEVAAAQRDMQTQNAAAMGGDQASFEKAMEKVAERIKAAHQRGDMQEVSRLADSIQRAVGAPTAAAGMQASERMERAAGKCGHEPQEPSRPNEPSFDRSVPPIPRTGSLWSDDEQFAIMWDRLEPLLFIEKEKDYEQALRRFFSENEQKALATHGGEMRGEIQRRNKLFET